MQKHLHLNGINITLYVFLLIPIYSHQSPRKVSTPEYSPKCAKMSNPSNNKDNPVKSFKTKFHTTKCLEG